MEPDTDVDYKDESLELKSYAVSGKIHADVEVDPDNSHVGKILSPPETEGCEESNHDLSSSRIGPSYSGALLKTLEPERDDSGADGYPRFQNTMICDQMDSLTCAATDIPSHVEPKQNDSQEVTMTEPDSGETSSRSQTVQSDSDNPKLQIIQDPVTMVCDRLQNAIQLLRNEVSPTEAGVILHTLIKIIRYNLNSEFCFLFSSFNQCLSTYAFSVRADILIICSNVIKHPNEVKFKKLRKVILRPACFNTFIRHEHLLIMMSSW